MALSITYRKVGKASAGATATRSETNTRERRGIEFHPGQGRYRAGLQTPASGLSAAPEIIAPLARPSTSGSGPDPKHNVWKVVLSSFDRNA
jgi:hypothetical protein